MSEPREGDSNEERYRQTFEQAWVGLAHVDPDGRFLAVNEKLAEILHRPRRELTGRLLANCVCTEDVDLANLESQVTAEAPSRRREIRLVLADGTLIWVQLGLSRVGGADGAACYYILMLEDVSDWRRAHASEMRLAKVLEATPDFVGTMSSARLPVYLNPAGRALLGISEEAELRNSDVFSNHPEWARHKLEAALPSVIAGKTWTGETAFLSPEGQEIPVLQILFAHSGVDGEVLITTIARDITELKAARRGPTPLP